MSLLKQAETNRRGAADAYGRLAGMEQNRNNTNKAISQQHKASQMSALGTGAAVAFMVNPAAGAAVAIGSLLLGGL